MVPKKCPVCGKDSIVPLPRTAVKLEGEAEPVSGVLAYRCSQGHVFIAPPKTRRMAKQ